MIDHVWSIACARGVIDNRTNVVSIHEVIEQINVKGDPKAKTNLQIGFEVVTMWSRADPATPGMGSERLSIWSPAGKRLEISNALALDLSAFQRFRSIRTVMGFPLVGAGRYFVQVELQNKGQTKWRKVAQIPIQVEFVPVEQAQPVKTKAGGGKKPRKKAS
jgi:hypothetical protein